MQKNNSVGSSNTYTPTPSGNGIALLSRGGFGFSPSNLTTLIIAAQADDTTNRTAMYNLIRSLNNNAF
jgi:hypothetical protein